MISATQQEWMTPLTPTDFTTSPENTFPEARTQTSVLLILRFDLSIFMSWWLPEETDQGQWSPLMKVAFQSGLDSKLSAGMKGVCFLHSKDFKKSHYQLLHNQYTSSLTTNLRTARSTYWYFTIFNPTGSFFFLELSRHTEQWTCHRHIYSHLSIKEKS